VLRLVAPALWALPIVAWDEDIKHPCSTGPAYFMYLLMMKMDESINQMNPQHPNLYPLGAVFAHSHPQMVFTYKEAWSKPCTCETTTITSVMDDIGLDETSCTCETTTITSVMDDIGLDDESFSVVIVGGGPHALAALTALHDHALLNGSSPSSLLKGTGASTLL
jgi:hypothetical protein